MSPEVVTSNHHARYSRGGVSSRLDAMKRFLHLIYSFHPALTPGTVRFYDRYFDHDQHSFCLYSENPALASAFPGDCTISHKSVCLNARNFLSCLRFIKYLDGFDVVVLHSMNVNWRTQFLLLCFYPSMLKKLVWIGWGSDLYNWKDSAVASLFGRFRIGLYRRFGAAIANFVAIFPPDVEAHARVFGGAGKTFYAPYVGVPTAPDQVPEWKPRRRDASKPFTVLIGHRCTPLVGHLECLGVLRRYREEDIRVIIPIGQGEDPQYVELVRKTAVRELGEKVSFVEKYMTRDELHILVAEVDAAMFHSARQIALGTLYLLFLSGTKVFMPAASVMSKFFKSQGIPISDIESLGTIDFADFSAPVDMRPGYDYAKDLNDFDRWAQHWSAVYDQIRGESA
jgi:hypothetical protein